MALGNGAEMRNVMALTSKQRAYLGGCASTMDPIFHIGKASLTPEIITALDEALEKRELIKVIGKKIVLFRQAKKNTKYELPG